MLTKLVIIMCLRQVMGKLYKTCLTKMTLDYYFVMQKIFCYYVITTGGKIVKANRLLLCNKSWHSRAVFQCTCIYKFVTCVHDLFAFSAVQTESRQNNRHTFIMTCILFIVGSIFPDNILIFNFNPRWLSP